MQKPPRVVAERRGEKMKVVYPELIGSLARKSITKIRIANALGISQRTLYSKLTGATDFTFSEANKIQQQFFPDVPIDKLFCRSDEQGA